MSDLFCDPGATSARDVARRAEWNMPDDGSTDTCRASVGARELRMIVEGEPVPKRTGKIMKFGNALTVQKNPKTRRYEEIVRERATHVWNGRPLLAGTPLTMETTFYRAIPRSWSKRDQQAARDGGIRPISKPDCSNYIKAFEDGLNGVVFVDDCLIVRMLVEKWYSERPRVEMMLEW